MRVDLEPMTTEQFDAYRASCDSRSSAEFRYRREACGIELAEISEDLGVRLDTAKRWENPKKGMPPSVRAWAYVDSAYLVLLDAVEAVIQRAEDADGGSGGTAPIRLPYRRGAQPARNGVPVGRANAVSRAAGIALGYEVAIGWAEDGAAGMAAEGR